MTNIGFNRLISPDLQKQTWHKDILTFKIMSIERRHSSDLIFKLFNLIRNIIE